MGASQSNHNNGIQRSGDHGITVVRSNPDGPESVIPRVNLPPRAPPILSLEHNQIDHRHHPAEFQMDPQLWVDFLSNIEKFINSRDEIVINRQNVLQKKIIIVDQHVQSFTDSYINDKHKTLAKMKDDIRKSTELEESLDKCSTQAKICIDMLNKLNFLLPENEKLEHLSDEI